MRKWLIGFLALGLLFGNQEVMAGKSYLGGSSGGSTSRPAASPSPRPSPSPSPRPSPSPAPMGRQYSSGGSSNSYTPPKQANSNSNSSDSRKPSSGGSWNPGLSGVAQREESKKNYQASQTPKPATKPADAPKPSYKTPTGVEKPIAPSSPEVTTVRKYVTHERYVTYDNRATTFYPPSIYAHPQPYNDFFSPFLMGYLLSDAMNSHQRAVWVYNHRDSMDDARYAELLRKDAKLQAELDAMKAQNLPRDASYVPEQMKDNPDLMYDKGFVDSSYNAQDNDDDDGPPSHFWHVVGQIVLWTVIVVISLFVLWIVVYAVFLRDAY